MADRLNADARVVVGPEHRLVVTRVDASIRLQFDPDLEDDVGFMPTSYTGTVSDDGVVQAVADPWEGPFVSPFRFGLNPYCYSTFILVTGRLTAAYGPDETLSGIVEDTFRAIPTGTFSVRSRFQTKPR